MVINTFVESKYIKLNISKNKFNRFNINPVNIVCTFKFTVL